MLHIIMKIDTLNFIQALSPRCHTLSQDEILILIPLFYDGYLWIAFYQRVK